MVAGTGAIGPVQASTNPVTAIACRGDSVILIGHLTVGVSAAAIKPATAQLKVVPQLGFWEAGWAGSPGLGALSAANAC